MRYSATIFPDRHQAFGSRLVPMTLGHAILLDRLRNPFAHPVPGGDPRPVHIDEALLCAMVCSRPWRKAERMIDTRRASLWLRWKFSSHSRFAILHILALRRYHAETWSEPECRILHAYTGPKRGAEFLALLAVSARTQLGINDPMDQPISRLQLELLVSAEQNGSLIIGQKPLPTLTQIAQAAMREKQSTQPPHA